MTQFESVWYSLIDILLHFISFPSFPSSSSIIPALWTELCQHVVHREVPQVVYEERVVEVPQMHNVEAITEVPKPQMQRVEKNLDWRWEYKRAGSSDSVCLISCSPIRRFAHMFFALIVCRLCFFLVAMCIILYSGIITLRGRYALMYWQCNLDCTEVGWSQRWSELSGRFQRYNFGHKNEWLKCQWPWRWSNQ